MTYLQITLQLSGGVSAQKNGNAAAVDATGKSEGGTGESSTRSTFERTESTKRQMSQNTRKTRTQKKVETMIAEMNIEVIRYQDKGSNYNSAARISIFFCWNFLASNNSLKF